MVFELFMQGKIAFILKAIESIIVGRVIFELYSWH